MSDWLKFYCDYKFEKFSNLSTFEFILFCFRNMYLKKVKIIFFFGLLEFKKADDYDEETVIILNDIDEINILRYQSCFYFFFAF